ncbi:hypothetical protein [Actinacidiphila glaucinigra]|uniref:hypothetical protein n=1 Tax=Actinacidiphila glaucinigra TaxID=235986 RepID=UPI002E3790DB|nr:hypothetical protein [Actinacidiphila glaucinigra]
MSTQAVPSRTPRTRAACPAVGGGTQTRLPWWALALPALAFAALLALVVGPGATEASAAEPVGQLLHAVGEGLPGLLQHLL